MYNYDAVNDSLKSSLDEDYIDFNDYEYELSKKVPLIIWSKDIIHKDIDTIIDTADIPVTLFNMFGINYEPKLYMGTDVFSENHEKFVYFNDYSWYDGTYYSKENREDEYTKRISQIVNQKISINEKIIQSNFYKYYHKK